MGSQLEPHFLFPAAGDADVGGRSCTATCDINIYKYFVCLFSTRSSSRMLLDVWPWIRDPFLFFSFFQQNCGRDWFSSPAAPPVCDSVNVNLSLFFFFVILSFHFFFYFCGESLYFFKQKKLMKKLDERERVSNPRRLLAPPPFLLSSLRQVVFTVAS